MYIYIYTYICCFQKTEGQKKCWVVLQFFFCVEYQGTSKIILEEFDDFSVTNYGPKDSRHTYPEARCKTYILTCHCRLPDPTKPCWLSGGTFTYDYHKKVICEFLIIYIYKSPLEYNNSINPHIKLYIIHIFSISTHMQVLSLGSLDFFPCSYGGKIIEHRSALTALKRDVFVCVCVFEWPMWGNAS